jgi:DnaJ-class molecular chaperone
LELRGVFDKYGEYGLKNGVTNHKGQKIGGYMFLGNSDQIFEAFFNNFSPLEDNFDLDGKDVFGSLLNDGFGGKRQPSHPAPSDIELTLNCSLGEFYNGSMKTTRYLRTKILPGGNIEHAVEEYVNFEVKPGQLIDSILVFKGRGNE